MIIDIELSGDDLKKIIKDHLESIVGCDDDTSDIIIETKGKQRWEKPISE